MKAWKVINPEGGTDDAEEKGLDDDSSHGFWRSHLSLFDFLGFLWNILLYLYLYFALCFKLYVEL
ncbi:unnamed protein product [Camellia sinensis]